MKLLAIDTATEACSAAVLSGETVVMRYEEPKRGHSEKILPMVDAVLAEAALQLRDLDAIAVGRGPGAFTGVRIAISVAQGLAFGAGKPVVPVSDLAALAQRAVDEHGAREVVACIDARMQEVYWGHFATEGDGLVSLIGEEALCLPGSVTLPRSDTWVGAGSGWALKEMKEAVSTRGGRVHTYPSLLPRAREVARLARRDFLAGRAVPPEQALPVYLRDQVARKPPSGDAG